MLVVSPWEPKIHEETHDKIADVWDPHQSFINLHLLKGNLWIGSINFETKFGLCRQFYRPKFDFSTWLSMFASLLQYLEINIFKLLSPTIVASSCSRWKTCFFLCLQLAARWNYVVLLPTSWTCLNLRTSSHNTIVSGRSMTTPRTPHI